ncbi:PREDICTED: uncharacterized protein LOC105457310 [Wasmannia auropunctata]|uniref:uncharacterized protein LOC105457310 n=1 Tax=Wasmannia auropunctata TaxID=64793 RepID=UPI0005EE6921|nr:PREDICTED: uncharacterized protein LOC105457310 [Wasmannia auropunctata]
MKFDCSIKSYSIRYTILSTFSAISAVTGGMLFILDGQIPYGTVWVPWDCTSFLLFYLTSFQEIAAVLIAVVVNIATETTILGFCLQTCAQFEILKHRLQKMAKEKLDEKERTWILNNTLNKTSRLSEHVSHHLCIISRSQAMAAQAADELFSTLQRYRSLFLVLAT